jgi:hypothetical protein
MRDEKILKAAAEVRKIEDELKYVCSRLNELQDEFRKWNRASEDASARLGAAKNALIEVAREKS